MDDFRESCDGADEFPANLIYYDNYGHNLTAYANRLDEKQADLFTEEERASLDIREYEEQPRNSISTCLESLRQLKDCLCGASPTTRIDPACRYAFLHAPNSRARLYTSRKMLTYLLTYHQVMPAFLDFIFPFGRKEHARDLYFGGFRHETRLEPMYKALEIPMLGRSGREVRMCYTLKSVEPSEYNPSTPWSIRQTAVYHSLDVETGKAFWVIVKGDELMKERIEDAAELPPARNTLGGQGQEGITFTEALSTHMILCDWSGEHWRWYISYLEEAVREQTGSALAAMVEPLVRPTPEKASKAVTWNASSEKRSLRSSNTFKSISSIRSSSLFKGRSLSLSSDTSRSVSKPVRSNSILKPSAANTPPPPQRSNTLQSQSSTMPSPAKFSFADLQRLQLFEDRANEVLLILGSNINVLSALNEHYQSVTKSQHFPEELIRKCENEVERFAKRTLSVIDDLRMHQSRTTTLLRLLADRKSLLYSILEYQNIEASKDLAKRAQESTENMEVMTKDMHILAKKTTQETVSMRIITLVTLFFLPGTFISVSLFLLPTRMKHTIMSTDIVQFQTDSSGKSQEVFSPGALRLFLTICLPMMLTTFVAWYGVYFWVNRKDALKRQKELELIGAV